MLANTNRIYLLLLLVFSFQSVSFSDDKDKPGLRAFKLYQLNRGNTLFNAMNDEGGIADVMDEDATHKFTVGSYETAKSLEEEFSPEVQRNFKSVFKDGEEGFEILMNELEGKKYTAATITAGIAKVLDAKKLLKNPKQIGLSAAKLTTIIEAMSQDAGVEIPLNNEVRTFHFNYKKGIDKSQDESTQEGETVEMKRRRTKSGRSYIDIGLGNRRTHDPSDKYYLASVAKYFDTIKNPWPLYEVMMDIMIDNNTSGVETLTKQGKTVLGDWFGIYIAEQRRHRMTGWTKMDWENALTELTFLAPFTRDAGIIQTKSGEVVEGKLIDYFGIGNDGSGLGGKAGMERRKLQRKISAAMEEMHPEEHKALSAAIRASKGTDLCSATMKTINHPGKQELVRENGKEISSAMVNYLKKMTDSASEIAAKVGR